MAKYFIIPVEFIQNRKFETRVPAYYHYKLSQELLNPKPEPKQRPNIYSPVTTNRRNPTPFYQPLDSHQMERALYTVQIMIDMFHKKIPFELVNSADIVEIMDGIDRYLISLKSDIQLGHEAITAYARGVVNFREEAYKIYFRFMKRNPEALEKLYPNENSKINTLNLLGSFGIGNESLEALDPLVVMGRPPFDIDQIIPSGGTGREESYIQSLGINQDVPSLKDDGRDFDFEKFLGRP